MTDDEDPVVKLSKLVKSEPEAAVCTDADNGFADTVQNGEKPEDSGEMYENLEAPLSGRFN